MDIYENALKRTERQKKSESVYEAERLNHLLVAMGRGSSAMDFDYFLKSGMEALVELGILIGLKDDPVYTRSVKSGVYNNVAIAIISAQESDWRKADEFLQSAYNEVGLGPMGQYPST